MAFIDKLLVMMGLSVASQIIDKIPKCELTEEEKAERAEKRRLKRQQRVERDKRFARSMAFLAACAFIGLAIWAEFPIFKAIIPVSIVIAMVYMLSRRY